MFKVQRFTAEEEEEQGGGRDDSSSLLNRVLERAKARASAKRARLGASDGVQHQAGTGVARPERESGISGALDSGADSRRLSEGAVVSRGGQGLTPADGTSGKDRGAGVVDQEEKEGASESDEVSSDEEMGSSGSSGEDESDESDDDDDEGDSAEEEAEIQTSPPGAAAAREDERDGDERETGEQGLRPMEEVAEEWGLDSRLAETLREEGVKHFFPIQVLFCVPKADAVGLYVCVDW